MVCVSTVLFLDFRPSPRLHYLPLFYLTFGGECSYQTEGSDKEGSTRLKSALCGVVLESRRDRKRGDDDPTGRTSSVPSYGPPHPGGIRYPVSYNVPVGVSKFLTPLFKLPFSMFLKYDYKVGGVGPMFTY